MSYTELWEAVSTLKLRGRPNWRFELRCGPTQNMSSVRIEKMDLLAVTSNAALAAVMTNEWQPVYLFIDLITPDSDDPKHERMITVSHVFAVPHHAFARSWPRWLLVCFMKVERHELMEVFEVSGERLFYPAHGTEGDPYAIRERESR